MAVLSDSLWRTRFSRNPAVVGRSILLNDRRYEVIGVMPRVMDFPRGTEVWVPGGADQQILEADVIGPFNV